MALLRLKDHAAADKEFYEATNRPSSAPAKLAVLYSRACTPYACRSRDLSQQVGRTRDLDTFGDCGPGRDFRDQHVQRPGQPQGAMRQRVVRYRRAAQAR